MSDYRFRALALIVLAVLLLACLIAGTVLKLQDHDPGSLSQAGAALLGAVIALAAQALFAKPREDEHD